MGRQIRFFMDRGDESKFVEFVYSTGEVHMLPYRSLVPEPQEVVDLSDAFRVWLLNRSVSSRLVLRLVPEQKYYMVDEFASSVVEFNRTIIKNGEIHPGRLWAEFRFLNSKGEWTAKEPVFTKWYDILTKWIRTHYSREVDPDFYFGPGALELYRKGKVEVKYF